MVLSKKTALYDRDEKGNLLPIEVSVEIDLTDEEQLKYKDEKIKVIPIPRGKLKRIFAEVENKDEKGKEKLDFDGAIVGEHCIDPKIEEDEIKHIKPTLLSIIVNTIFRESGLKSGKNKMIEFLKGKGLYAEYLKYVKKKQLDDAEDEFAKN